MSQPRLRLCDRTQVAVQVASIDDLVEPDHEVRDLWEYVQALDLRELLAAIGSRSGRAGAPAHDPRVLLALWLYACARGIATARDLHRQCRESIPFRWLCADRAPNYHTLASFRSRSEQLLDRLLTDSLAVLVSEGLLKPEEMTVAHDGVRVRASAGRSSFRRRPTLEQALEEARLRVEQLKGEARSNATSRRAEKARERAARDRHERVQSALGAMEELEAKRRKEGRPEPRVSTTDPEAMRMKMGNGGIDPAYNIQVTTDVESRAITAVGVAPCGSDYGQLLPAALDHERRLGSPPARVLADEGFVKADDIEALEQADCAVLAPDKHGETERGRKGAGIDAWRARMRDEQAVAEYARLRPATAEWTNAQLRNRGLQRITLRGRAKARAVALLHALTHNMQQTFRLRELAATKAATA